MEQFVIISGCSSGGKSSLLAELARRGFAVVEEPGRRIVRQEQARGGDALPWVDPVAFGRRALAMARDDREAARGASGWVFFDRGLIDAAAALERMVGEALSQNIGAADRYHRRTFLAPPWPEIYVTDPERRHGIDAAMVEYRHLLTVYASLGYEAVILPKASVVERADFVLRTLAE